MALYHFNVEDGCSFPDIEGTELPSLAAARIEAVKLSGALYMKARKRFESARIGLLP